jgi:hypothetical protein
MSNVNHCLRALSKMVLYAYTKFVPGEKGEEG